MSFCNILVFFMYIYLVLRLKCDNSKITFLFQIVKDEASMVKNPSILYYILSKVCQVNTISAICNCHTKYLYALKTLKTTIAHLFKLIHKSVLLGTRFMKLPKKIY